MENKIVDYNFLGKEIRKKRLQMQLSQEKIAEVVDISCSFLSCIERGKVVLSVNTLVKIAKALNLSLDYLLLNNPVLDKKDFLKTIDTLLLDMSSEQKKHVINFLRLLADNIDKIK